MKKPELLAPAGNLEKLKIAITYGADAVYIAGKKYGLRAAAGNFTMPELTEGVHYAHKKGKKVYVALNILPHNSDLEGLDKYIKDLESIKVDALIVADPGVLSLTKEIAPDMAITLSTQVNTTNWKSALFWHKLGVNRITVARELSIDEIKTIVQNTPATLEIEAFIHGAMCISYSGRCLLSNYMTHRDSNRGACSHPCRWTYSLVEEQRPGHYFPVYEDERGTSIFSSKDLCLIESIPELIQSGLTSFKIEGRMKSAYYVAATVSVYRQAIDNFINNPSDYKFDPAWIEELEKVNHREYTKGFLFSKPDSKEQIYDAVSYIKNYDYAGLIMDYNKKTKTATLKQQNKMMVGDSIEIIRPFRNYFSQSIGNMWNMDGNPIEAAPHAKQIIKMKMDYPVKPMDIIRKKI
jgi:putative protease